MNIDIIAISSGKISTKTELILNDFKKDSGNKSWGTEINRLLMGEEADLSDFKSSELEQFALCLSERFINEQEVINIKLKQRQESIDCFVEKYKFDNLIKKIFIYESLSDSKSTTAFRLTQNVLKSTFDHIESAEIELGKSILSFNRAEMEMFLSNEAENSYSVMGLINMGSRVRKFRDFYEDIIKKNDIADEEFKAIGDAYNIMNKLLGKGAQKQQLITYNELLNVLYETEDLQFVAPLLLAFEGAKVNRNPKLNEITNLKKDDVYEGYVIINSPELGESRKLDIEEDASQYLLLAARQKLITIRNRSTEQEVENSSPYLLVGRSFNNISNRVTPIVVVQRLKQLNDDFSPYLGDLKLSFKLLRNSGKVFYIKKYIDSGLSFDESVYKVLYRFGDIKKAQYDNPDRPAYQKAYAAKKLYKFNEPIMR